MVLKQCRSLFLSLNAWIHLVSVAYSWEVVEIWIIWLYIYKLVMWLLYLWIHWLIYDWQPAITIYGPWWEIVLQWLALLHILIFYYWTYGCASPVQSCGKLQMKQFTYTFRQLNIIYIHIYIYIYMYITIAVIKQIQNGIWELRIK